MELRHLRYFVAVAEELNFRRAAERLHITRPALSKQIKDLEFQTGVRLLERDTVSVSLTDAGSVFLAEARGILRHEADGPQLDAGISGGPALIENPRPWRIARVVGEFHAPGTGRISDANGHVS